MDFKINSRQELLIFNRITSYLEDMFDLDDMTLVYDAHGDSVAISSKEEWDDYFKVYFHDYWNPYNAEGQKMAKDSPILQVEKKYEEELDSLFGNKWEEPMKQFIENNFEFKIKTILKKHDRF